MGIFFFMGQNTHIHQSVELNAITLELLKTLSPADLKTCIDLLYEQPTNEELFDDVRYESNHSSCAIYRAIMALNLRF